MYVCDLVVGVAKRSVRSITKIEGDIERQLTIFKLHFMVMFKLLSLNNFCIFLSASEPLMFKILLIHRPCMNQYLFYYNFLKVDKEENYQRLHKPLLHRMLPWLHQITFLPF